MNAFAGDWSTRTPAATSDRALRAVDAPVPRETVRLLVVDPSAAAVESARFADLPDFLDAGDVVVVNDAATLPAVLRGHVDGTFVEARLLDVDPPWATAVLFGPGDHRTRTEHRAPPVRVTVGDVLRFGALSARVAEVSLRSPRLVTLDVGSPEAFWPALYAAGSPVQYAYRPEALPLWAIQTAYAGRPWAAEMPSAGRPLTWDLVLRLRRRGVPVVALTHAAGLSATGDPALDDALPLPERFEIPEATARVVSSARGRVVAIGTSVVRALESAAEPGGVRAGPGVATLILDTDHRRQVVDGLVSGIHGPDESHYRLLGAFADSDTLSVATRVASTLGYHRHELGDACLLLPGELARRAAA